jgi:hypothetical protein
MAQFPFGLAVDRRHGETLANDWYHVLGIGFNGLKCSEDASNCSVEKRDIELRHTMKPYTSVDSTFFILVMNDPHRAMPKTWAFKYRYATSTLGLCTIYCRS